MSPALYLLIPWSFLLHDLILPSMWQVHHIGHLDAEDLDLSGTKKKYKKLTSFANSKLAQVCMSVVVIPSVLALNSSLHNCRVGAIVLIQRELQILSKHSLSSLPYKMEVYERYYIEFYL